MATFEQCEKALRKQLKTRADVLEFCGTWGGGYHSEVYAGDESTFVHENIKWLVDQAKRKGLLDDLGMKLDLPSDAESKRLDTRGAIKRSWLALVIAGFALLVSILVAIFK